MQQDSAVILVKMLAHNVDLLIYEVNLNHSDCMHFVVIGGSVVIQHQVMDNCVVVTYPLVVICHMYRVNYQYQCPYYQVHCSASRQNSPKHRSSYVQHKQIYHSSLILAVMAVVVLMLHSLSQVKSLAVTFSQQPMLMSDKLAMAA